MSDTPSASDTAALSVGEQALAVWDLVQEPRIILDTEWRYRYINAAARSLLRLPDDVVGRDSRLIHPEAPATEFGAAYRHVMDTAEPVEVEHHYEPLDTFLRARIWPVPGGGICIALTDLTEERRPQARLQHNLDLYQQVLDHTTQAMTLRDRDSRFLLANRAATARIGRPAKEIVGRTPDQLFPPDIAQAIRDIDVRVLATGEPESGAPAHAFQPDRNVLAQVFPIWDDENRDIVGVGTTVTDVTELAVAQAELAASQRRFRRVFGSTSLGILVMRGDGRLIEVNSALCRLLGYSRSTLLQMTGLDLVGADSEGFQERRNRLRTEAQHGYEIEEEFVRSDGQRIPVLLTVNAFDDPAGRGRLFSCVVRDLTMIRQLQTQLVTVERMEAVGRLAAGIAHDANNILAAVSGYAELLAEEVEGNPAARRHLDGISRSIERAGEMVARLLAFTRGQPMEPALIDLAALVGDLADMLRQLLPAGVELELELEPALVWADASQLRQIVLNLVVNARNALQDTGCIRIRTGRDDRQSAVLSVSDDGPGMTADVARRCFEPFFSTRQSSGGTGLGLSTALGIARQSGGDLRVRSTPGNGSTFVLQLPAAERSAAAPLPGRPGSARILVADDDPALREVMVTTLQNAGYSVTAAPDGVSALNAGTDVDLVVSDIDMPGLDGLELVAELARKRPGLPVLLVSGAATPPAGTAFLGKPFTRAALLTAVQSALAGAS